MGLQPLEFSDCLTDSPYFREKLHSHEKELERTSKAIKGLIAECKELVSATRNLSKAQRNLSATLSNFKFDCIGSEQTEDEVIIESSLKEFGKLLSAVEDERDRLLNRAVDGILRPLEVFRKTQIGGAKEGKKKFDKETAKFCQSLERNLNMKTKISEDQLKEADMCLEMEKKHFYESSMLYVRQLQEVQERKKFEFVEILLSFMYSWLTFYHQGHEVAEDFKPYMTDLQMKLQKCRDNFDIYREESETLMNKMLEVRRPKQEQNNQTKACTKEGYLFLMEKKALGTQWSKHYCQYQKENKILTMIPYSQVTGKGVSGITTETMVVTSCTRRASDSIEKRFCFDITTQDKPQTLTLQSIAEDDRRQWLDAMDGREPVYSQPTKSDELDSLLDDIGFSFIKRCITVVETRGLDEEGLYRIVGVASKVCKLTNLGLDRRKADKLVLENETEWETKTITSAIKNYFRSLPEPMMTFRMHAQFIQAAKSDTRTLRINEVHELVHQLPEPTFEMLVILIAHLRRISEQCATNLMTIANLGVCFGPTLMRAKEESLSSIIDIKWCNLVIEILIDNYEQIFKTPPQFAAMENIRVLPSTKPVINNTPTISTFAPATQTMGGSSSRHKPSALTMTPPSVQDENLPARETTPTQAFNNHNHSQSQSPVTKATSSSIMTTSMPDANQLYANVAESPNSGVSVSMANNGGVMTQSYDAGNTYAAYRAKLRPTGGFYSQYSGDILSSASSSTESLNSKCSGSSQTTSTTQSSVDNRKSSGAPNVPAVPPHSNPDDNFLQIEENDPVEIMRLKRSPRALREFYQPEFASISKSATILMPKPPAKKPPLPNRSSQYQSPATTPAVPPNRPEPPGAGFGHKKRKSADSLTFSMSSSASSVSSLSSGPQSGNRTSAGRKVRTLYSCEAENESELSFEPNTILLNVKPSREPGWLEGMLDGKTGLVPANYVEYLS